MKINEIYLILQGRIGNQLFMYAFVKNIQNTIGENCTIVIDDTDVINLHWEDSLQFYELNNVRYVHTHDELYSKRWKFKSFLLKIINKLTLNKDYLTKFRIENNLKPILNMFGVINLENGLLKFNFNKKRDYLVKGYFQAEEYFKPVAEELINTFTFPNTLEYPNLKLLKESNSVCISVKVEHNVGSSLYAVCGKEYWKEAIEYIISQVENPLFFICSDNVDYVKSNLIDCEKYKTIFQDMSQPVSKSLAAMAQCKHFIIGNTSYGWWAQYMSKNPQKIVCAPNQWMLVDMPIALYQNNWHLIDVKKYLSEK